MPEAKQRLCVCLQERPVFRCVNLVLALFVVHFKSFLFTLDSAAGCLCVSCSVVFDQCGRMILFHEAVDRFVHFFDGFPVILPDGLYNAVLHMLLENELSGIVDL